MAYDPLNPGAVLGNPNAPKRKPMMGSGTLPDGEEHTSEEEPGYQANPPGIPYGTGTSPSPGPAMGSGTMPSLYDTMKYRMDAVQGGQADPGANSYAAPTAAPVDPYTPAPAAAPVAPAAGQSLYETMKARMAAVQSGQPDPGNNPALAAVAAPGGSGAPGQSTISGQAGAASTYSGTPGAAPTANTTNQGTQDVYRNSLLQRATQGTDVDTNDPTFRKVADTYAASQERSRRNATDMAGESLAANGMASSGQMDNEARLQTERAAQGSAGFESQLALSELQNKRSEIADALSQLGSSIGGDQQRALTDKLAQLDATIKRESLSQTGALGQADIALRDRLGTQGNNLSALELLLRNQQQNNSLGADIGYKNAMLNNNAMNSLFS